MIINAFYGLDVEMCDIEIYIGKTLFRKERTIMDVSAQMFRDTVINVSRDPRPIQVRWHKYVETDSGKRLIDKLVFSNNMFLQQFPDFQI